MNFSDKNDSFLERTADRALQQRIAKQQIADERFVAFLSEHDTTNKQYEVEKVEAIERGETVWMLRNPDADLGQVFDLFKDKIWVGYVEYSDSIATIVVPTGDPSESLVVIDEIEQGTGHENLMEALERLETISEKPVED